MLGWGWPMTDTNAQLSVRIQHGQPQLSLTQSGLGWNQFLAIRFLPKLLEADVGGVGAVSFILGIISLILGSLPPKSLKTKCVTGLYT